MNELQIVAPVRPVAPWLGGKRNLAKRLVGTINAIPHDTYAEPFVGMGGIFLRRDHRPKCEVINDANEDVATLFRVLQHHYLAFVEMIRFQISSRANFEKLCRQDPTTLTDLQRAARFLYLQRLAFGGKVAGARSFGVAPGLGGRFDVTKLVPMLEEVSERMAGVIIERLDWQAFIKRWDRPRTLFYLDPPYFGSEKDYGSDLFDRSQFEAMAQCLAQLKGRFILSINDHPQVRRIFAGFAMAEVGTTYSIGSNSKRVGELVISG
ncbi:DNA adenine methylase [Altericroceibacterium endophyticum]|uniref:site-specific DNA-methyltransferase (adenine-specific) n=1 Tax=Altericroceibacterium endophyticum TaxID=1808508 RepID=A0A6I4T4Q1_9SPHN|nr:DNA adenine methylase [Altericroceibacterium endophyticum]MXO66234.1 DNA adenine methylase [Altericroceibacterium endophyticum]